MNIIIAMSRLPSSNGLELGKSFTDRRMRRESMPAPGMAASRNTWMAVPDTSHATAVAVGLSRRTGISADPQPQPTSPMVTPGVRSCGNSIGR